MPTAIYDSNLQAKTLQDESGKTSSKTGTDDEDVDMLIRKRRHNYNQFVVIKFACDSWSVTD